MLYPGVDHPSSRNCGYWKASQGCEGLGHSRILSCGVCLPLQNCPKAHGKARVQACGSQMQGAGGVQGKCRPRLMGSPLQTCDWSGFLPCLPCFLPSNLGHFNSARATGSHTQRPDLFRSRFDPDVATQVQAAFVCNSFFLKSFLLSFIFLFARMVSYLRE